MAVAVACKRAALATLRASGALESFRQAQQQPMHDLYHLRFGGWHGEVVQPLHFVKKKHCVRPARSPPQPLVEAGRPLPLDDFNSQRRALQWWPRWRFCSLSPVASVPGNTLPCTSSKEQHQGTPNPSRDGCG